MEQKSTIIRNEKWKKIRRILLGKEGFVTDEIIQRKYDRITSHAFWVLAFVSLFFNNLTMGETLISNPNLNPYAEVIIQAYQSVITALIVVYAVISLFLSGAILVPRNTKDIPILCIRLMVKSMLIYYVFEFGIMIVRMMVYIPEKLKSYSIYKILYYTNQSVIGKWWLMLLIGVITYIISLLMIYARDSDEKRLYQE